MNLSELDYYNILNVPRNATKAEITIAYRKLAIKLCPLRDAAHLRNFGQTENIYTHMTPLSLKKQWDYINLAFDTLGNDLRRAVYDRFGETGLLQGVALTGGYFPPYQYHGDNMKVYHDAFSSFSPYAHIIDNIVENSPPLYNNKDQGIGVKTKAEAVTKEIWLDLEEVYHGCIKLMHVMRQEFVDENSKTSEKKKKTLTVNIPPGVTAGTCFCFKEEGDQIPSKIPSDIIFMVRDKPHPKFTRVNQHDILLKHEISLCHALTGFRFTVETLDKRKLTVSLYDVIGPGYRKIIPKEGLPMCKALDAAASLKTASGHDYGDLIIEFPIKFPIYLTPAMKQLTQDYFKNLLALETEAKRNTSKITGKN